MSTDYGAGALIGMIGGHQQERRNYRKKFIETYDW